MESGSPPSAFTRGLRRFGSGALGWEQSHEAVRWWFLRAMGLCYLAAFYSLTWQVGALYYTDGLTPVAAYLDQVDKYLPVALIRWQQVPTLFWISHSDAVLLGAAWVGVVLSILVCLNLGTRLTLPLLWVTYLSFVSVGQVFLSYQWDVLLLETGFLAMLFALTDRVSLLVLWLLRWLVFRLMWLNGMVKILAVDRDYLDGTSSTWWEGTALSFHYFTQPLPAWPAWFLHHLPGWWHAFTTYGTLLVELAVPFLIFLGRLPRLAAVVVFATLHVVIWLAGSQAFYNLLGVTLLIPLLDDRWLATFRRWLRVDCLKEFRPLARLAGAWRRGMDLRWTGAWARSRQAHLASQIVLALVAGLLVVLSVFVLNQRLQWFGTNDWMKTTLRDAAPFYLVSNYGAFGNMTRTRPEIIVEGSDDGITWKEYGFYHKPGELDRAPGWVAPLQPRLDWQLWFSALGAPSPWMGNFAKGIAEQNPQLLSLIRVNPFADKPPQYLRLVKYDYEFTGWDEGWKTGDWWKRKEVVATPPLRLDNL